MLKKPQTKMLNAIPSHCKLPLFSTGLSLTNYISLCLSKSRAAQQKLSVLKWSHVFQYGTSVAAIESFYVTVLSIPPYLTLQLYNVPLAMP